MADAKKRPIRPSALRAQQTFLQSANGYDQPSSEDDGGGFEQGKAPARLSRRNTANPKVDLHKLDTISLQRYRKVYKLGEAPANTAKEDLVPSVARHFAAQVVDEEEVLVKAIQRHTGKHQQRHQQSAAPYQHTGAYQHHGGSVPPIVRKIVKPINVAALPHKSRR